jgi:hypothetical protein
MKCRFLHVTSPFLPVEGRGADAREVMWKQHFAADPLRSDLDRLRQ